MYRTAPKESIIDAMSGNEPIPINDCDEEFVPSDVEQRVIYELENIKSGLGETFRGALVVLRDKQNSERFKQSGVSIRNIIDVLEESNEKRQGSINRMRIMMKTINDAGKYTVSNIKNSSDEEFESIQQVLIALEEFRDFWNNSDTKNAQDHLNTISSFDPANAELPMKEQLGRARELGRMDEYFNKLAHDVYPTEKEYLDALNGFTEFVAEMIVPRSIEIHDDIDSLIEGF